MVQHNVSSRTHERILRGSAAFATMHGKEKVVAPVLFRELALPVSVCSGIDTDALGTFTGETPRAGSARGAALEKARLALDAEPSATYGIGSEGSFGPHASTPFITAGCETIVLLSRDGDLVVFGSDVTTETNCAEEIVTTFAGALDVAQHFGFPSHGAVVMGVRHGRVEPEAGSIKGIRSIAALEEAVTKTVAHCGAACVSSDMRAHMNPTRMRSIERAAMDLARSAQSRCPECRNPGYGPTDRVAGLPCIDCGEPTDLVLRIVYSCVRCTRREERPRPDGRSGANPGECDRCNP